MEGGEVGLRDAEASDEEDDVNYTLRRERLAESSESVDRVEEA